MRHARPASAFAIGLLALIVVVPACRGGLVPAADARSCCCRILLRHPLRILSRRALPRRSMLDPATPPEQLNCGLNWNFWARSVTSRAPLSHGLTTRPAARSRTSGL